MSASVTLLKIIVLERFSMQKS